MKTLRTGMALSLLWALASTGQAQQDDVRILLRRVPESSDALLIVRLKARGLSVEYVANTSGDHDERYWSTHTAEYLTFYAESWPRDLSSYPACTPNP